MSEPIIKVHKLGKRYRIGTKIDPKGRDNFRDAILNTLKAPFKNFKRLRKLTNFEDENTDTAKDIIWALKDVSFEINKGEVVGIIGRNGSGKSTLLKILSRITEPTEGYIELRGRVASLLEVGTGFHRELTGRENIYLNGSILGMKKWEIDKKFDEIVAFSEIEKFIDTPVKHYSSGMYVRLAFAVAAHLDPEILLVDEVLAVGDAEFQKKCLGKMHDIAKGGRTVLFVSHNMGIMQQLCGKVALLNQGSIVEYGKCDRVIKTYLSNFSQTQYAFSKENKTLKKNYISRIAFLNHEKNEAYIFGHTEDYFIKIDIYISESFANMHLGLVVIDQSGRKVFTSERKILQEIGKLSYLVGFKGNFLTPGYYNLLAAIHIPNTCLIDLVENAVKFEILDQGHNYSAYAGSDIGCVFCNCEWEII